MFCSFSKYFSMTGWRIGWMLVPERLRRPVDVLTGNFTICPPALAQYAALRGLRRRVVRRARRPRRAVRRQPARSCSTGCPPLGITELAPADGAFYVYADVGHLTDDSMALRPRPARRRPGSPSPPASTSTPRSATGSSGSASPDRASDVERVWPGWTAVPGVPHAVESAAWLVGRGPSGMAARSATRVDEAVADPLRVVAHLRGVDDPAGAVGDLARPGRCRSTRCSSSGRPSSASPSRACRPPS